MVKFKELFGLKEPSFLIVILPYIGFNWSEIYDSPFYNIQSLVLLLFSLFIIEVFLKFITKNKKYYTPIGILFLTLTLILFYGYYLVSFIQNKTALYIRGRSIMLIMLIILMLFLYLVQKRFKGYKILNTFFLIFGALTFVNNTYTTKNKVVDINSFNNNYIRLKNKPEKTKPVILIISDEYNSPDGLYNIYKDSSLYNFSKKLVNNGWLVHNSFYTYEISTIHSLSSLFNYNLSIKGGYEKMNTTAIGVNKLLHSAIYDSLKTKNVSIINYGIFDIGENKPLNRLYFYPLNFFEVFFSNTSVFSIVYNTGKFNKAGMKNDYFPMEQHNKYILNNLNNNLTKKIDDRFFSYVHLYMPHSPMKFGPDFPLINKVDLDNYLSYWNFTNKKLDSLLNSLTKGGKYRIILTGDHGFRHDTKINPHFTFTAFYGFDSTAVKNIKSVQDLGSLINSVY